MNILNGLLDVSAWQLVGYTLLMTHVTMAAVTIYLHRHSAHRALDLHPAVAHFFRFWLWMTTGMVTREWTAVHRKHHSATETVDDPHSPVIHGLGTVLRRGAELYRDAINPEMVEKFGKGTPDDWVERNIYSRFSAGGVTLMALIDVALFGPIGLTVWAIQMVWTPFFAAGVINGIGHALGYRNFECPDAATNIVPWGILIGGEELHNNHHTYPNSARLSSRPWEFDIGWLYICLLERAGLAHVRSRGPMAEQIPGKRTVDSDTVWGLLNDRFHVMARFASEVVTPLLEQARTGADRATSSRLRQARRLLVRNETLLNDGDRAQLQQVASEQPLVRTLYELRGGLQELWSQRGASSEQMIETFVAWCRNAEASGLSRVREFAEELKSYSVPVRAGAQPA